MTTTENTTFLTKCENTIRVLRTTQTADLAPCRDAYAKGNAAGRLIALFADLELARRN